MSILIPPLYHWSPHENFHDISKHGLQVYRLNHEGYGWPYICFGTTPSSAWGLLGELKDLDSEVDEFDLWQYQPRPDDDIRIRSDFGAYIREIRVNHPVPASDIWWVGTRTHPYAIEPKPKAKPRPRKQKK